MPCAGVNLCHFSCHSIYFVLENNRTSEYHNLGLGLTPPKIPPRGRSRIKTMTPLRFPELRFVAQEITAATNLVAQSLKKGKTEFESERKAFLKTAKEQAGKDKPSASKNAKKRVRGSRWKPVVLEHIIREQGLLCAVDACIIP